MSTLASGTVTSPDGTVIAYDARGDGPALVVVDGAFCHRTFGPSPTLAPLLAGHFTVYTYDRRGRGLSGDTPPYAVAREVEDLAALVTEAGGRANVYAFSSGGLLALHAAAAGLGIERLALMEPPIGTDDDPSDAAFTAELAELVAAGRRGDAVEHFMAGIGVPEEMLAGMRGTPSWSGLEAVAHTLVHDATIALGTTPELLAAVTAPVLVLDSEGSSEDISGSAAAAARALPNATHRSLPGSWHGVPDDDLAPVVREFFSGGPR
jgi:pimeloyl-ACP methyl ester carboxylesterase